MNFADILGNVRRLVEDESSLRWTDKVISEYIIEGVNEVFRRSGGVTDSSPYDFVQGESEYVVQEAGRITGVRIRPSNNSQVLALSQIQVEALPVDFSTERDPTHYAISQVAIQGDSSFLGTVGGSPATLTAQEITYTAISNGVAGNNITVSLVDPLASSSSLSIGVIGTDISVDLATDGAGDITTDIDSLVLALNLDPLVTALIGVSGYGSEVLVASGATSLSGGENEPLYSSENTGSLTEKQKLLFNYRPSRSTSGAFDGIYGFYVDVAREFTLDLSTGGTYINGSGDAEAALNTEVLPVLSKFDRHLTNMVAGTLLMELNDTGMYQKGQVMSETARQYIGNIGYVNSISMYSNDPGRLFP